MGPGRAGRPGPTLTRAPSTQDRAERKPSGRERCRPALRSPWPSPVDPSLSSAPLFSSATLPWPANSHLQLAKPPPRTPASLLLRDYETRLGWSPGVMAPYFTSDRYLEPLKRKRKTEKRQMIGVAGGGSAGRRTSADGCRTLTRRHKSSATDTRAAIVNSSQSIDGRTEKKRFRKRLGRDRDARVDNGARGRDHVEGPRSG